MARPKSRPGSLDLIPVRGSDATEWPRTCPLCGLTEEHLDDPRHAILGGPNYHLDCHAALGCVVCQLQTEHFKGDVHGQARSMFDGDLPAALRDPDYSLRLKDYPGAAYAVRLESGMTMGFDLTRKTVILDAMMTGAAATGLVPTLPLKLALMSAAGTDAATGTEVTGGSYARQSITMGASTVLATVGRRSANSTAPSFAGSPAVTVNSGEWFDSAATPVRQCQGNLATPKTLAAGDTLTVPAGSATVDLP